MPRRFRPGEQGRPWTSKPCEEKSTNWTSASYCSSANAPPPPRKSAACATDLPVYEPNRERVIFENVRTHNPGPLPDIELVHIYERIVDVMRALQRNELASRPGTPATAAPQNPTGKER